MVGSDTEIYQHRQRGIYNLACAFFLSMHSIIACEQCNLIDHSVSFFLSNGQAWSEKKESGHGSLLHAINGLEKVFRKFHRQEHQRGEIAS